MNLVTIAVSILLAIFSTAVMSYIAMAVPIGPWIDPTIILCAMVLFARMRQYIIEYNKRIAYVTVSGGVGGIIATACGFSFPTLYFLDPALFQRWLSSPLYFMTILSSLVFVSGWYGLWIANMIQKPLLDQESLPFPIGMLLYKMIAAHTHIYHSVQLMIGFISTVLFCILQRGIYVVQALIPRFISIVPQLSWGVLQTPLIQLDFALLPMLLAIGFISGHMITVPLLLGSCAHMFLAKPIYTFFFPQLLFSDFLLAFCSGMVLAGAISGMYSLIRSCISSIYVPISVSTLYACKPRWIHLAECFFVLLCCGAFFSYFRFPLYVQIYLFITTFICSYHIAIIAGKIGLAPLGRFATFVMVPALFFFHLDMVQIVLLSTFVEIAGGVTADVLFGRKLAQQGNFSMTTIQKYQYAGLIVTTLVIGIVFWLLVSHFQLGSADLFAQKAYARRLLIHVQEFHYGVLALGCLFGYVLHILRINPMLVLGGLLMPMNVSFGLILGGMLTLITKNKEFYIPFWSGVFAANSIWMLLQALCATCS